MKKEEEKIFLSQKYILKCLVSIIIKKWINIFQNSESQHRWRGSGQVGQKPTF